MKSLKSWIENRCWYHIKMLIFSLMIVCSVARPSICSYWQFLFFYMLHILIENETGSDVRIIIAAIANRTSDETITCGRPLERMTLLAYESVTSARSLEVPNSITRPSLRTFAKVSRCKLDRSKIYRNDQSKYIKINVRINSCDKISIYFLRVVIFLYTLKHYLRLINI